MKVCSRCKVEKPLSEFYRQSDSKDGYTSYCKTCSNAHSKAWLHSLNGRLYAKGRGRIKKRYSYIKRTYGLSASEYDALKMQKMCDICGCTFEIGQRCIDHDHSTGKVRGTLCRNCNTMLGLAKDTPAVLRIAAEYLEKNTEVSRESTTIGTVVV